MQSASMGIDVSKAKLDVLLLTADGPQAYQQVSNTPSGHQQLTTWVRQHTSDPVTVCLEATGRYGLAVAQHLYQQGYTVSVVNPAAVKHVAQAMMKRHKTDRSDAHGLACYQRHMQPPLWQPPTRVQSHLQALKRLADDLQLDRTRVKNRLEGLLASSPARRYLEAQLQQLEQPLAQVEDEIQQLLDDDAHLQAQCQLLVSIKGIGTISALQLLAELPDIGQFASADQLVAYAGLCPHQQQSGAQRSVSWLSKQGNPRLRKAVYFPALSAQVHHPHLRPFAQRLAAAGKAKLVVVAAVMRKLLVLVYTILKSGHPYDPSFGFSS